MADVAHSTTSITGGHTNAVAAGAAGFMSGTDKSNLDGLTTGAAQALLKNGTVTATAALPMGSNKITGLASGTASGDAVHFGQTATQTTAGLVTAATQLKVDSFIVAWAGTTVALPAYTYANGSSGVGATMTANANGAFPTLDGGVSLTANDSVQGVFLNHNGASSVDNGVYLLTQQGDAGNPWIATRHTACDTPTKLRICKVRVANGQQKAGCEYIYKAVATPTIGTTGIYLWPTDPEGHSPNEYTCLINTDFMWGGTNGTGGSLNDSGLAAFPTGAGAAVTMVARTSNTTTRRGIMSQTTGTTTTGAHLMAHVGAIFMGADDGFFLEWKGGVPTLSDGTNTFSMFVGFADATTASPTNAVILSFQPLISTTDWQLTTSSGGTPTNTASGRTIVAGTDDHVILRKDPGDVNIYFWMNGVQVGSGVSTNVPTATALNLFFNVLKSAGTVTRAFESDMCRVYSYTPKGRAA